MAKWPLISKEEDHHAQGCHTRRGQLPLFYMNDHSRLGLRVDACHEARRALTENHYEVVQDDEGLHVVIENAAQVPAIVALLEGRGVACEVVDLIEQAYQG